MVELQCIGFTEGRRPDAEGEHDKNGRNKKACSGREFERNCKVGDVGDYFRGTAF